MLKIQPATTASTPVHTGVVARRSHSGIGSRELILPHTKPAATTLAKDRITPSATLTASP